MRWGEIVPLLTAYHYRGGAIGGSIKVVLGLFAGSTIVGGAALGKPWHATHNGGRKTIELRRLVCHDDAPKNTESYFISRCLWWLKNNTDYERVLSYSDTSVGHTGTIYRASGFRLVGESRGGSVIVRDGRCYHARSLTIDRDYARQLADDVRTGKATVVRTGVKMIWVRDIR